VKSIRQKADVFFEQFFSPDRMGKNVLIYAIKDIAFCKQITN